MRQEMMGFWDGSGIGKRLNKQSELCSGQITTPTPHHWIFTGQMLFLTPNQQCQSTEGKITKCLCTRIHWYYTITPLMFYYVNDRSAFLNC